MSTPVTLPALGESVTEGTVTRWLKQVGDNVEVDEPLLEVSTDKVDTEIPSPVAGTILEIKAEEDETIEVGAELCVIGDEGEGGGSSDEGGQASSDASSEAESQGESQAEETPQAQETPEEPSEPQQQAQAQPAEQASQPTADEQPAQPQGDASQSGEGTEVKLPELGESVTEGTVTRWLKQVGDEVEVDEALLEVSTDKVDTEIPSPVAGTLQEIKVQEDETVEVGAVLCIVGSGAPAQGGGGQAAPAQEEQPAREEQPAQEQPAQEQPSQEQPSQEQAEQPAPKPQQAEQPAQEQQAQAAEPQQPAQQPQQEAPSDGEGGAYVTPLVRKMAAEHGVDLAEIQGSGVGGRIRKQDVIAAAEAKKQAAAPQAPAAQAPAAEAAPSGAPSGAPSPLRGRVEKMSRLRKVIAARMVESLQVSAQLTTVVEVDVTAIARLRDSVKAEFAAREGVKLSFLPFFAKAAVDALKVHPSLNAGIDTEKGEITYYDHENLSVAVDTERGLLTPVIKDAGDLSISGLAKKIADVADRTRNNKIGPDELAGGTFTLTNTGSRGALFDTPIINQPQVGILGTGSVVKRPVVIDDPNLGETIAVRHMVYLALTYDHRLVDGADAARFLSDVKARLESGQFEV